MTEAIHWTKELDARLIELANMGGTHRSIAADIGRSRTAVANRLIHLEAQRANADVWASKYLGEAILDAQARFADAFGLTLAEAQVKLMGNVSTYRAPGTERVLQTCAVERLAA